MQPSYTERALACRGPGSATMAICTSTIQEAPVRTCMPRLQVLGLRSLNRRLIVCSGPQNRAANRFGHSGGLKIRLAPRYAVYNKSCETSISPARSASTSLKFSGPDPFQSPRVHLPSSLTASIFNERSIASSNRGRWHRQNEHLNRIIRQCAGQVTPFGASF